MVFLIHTELRCTVNHTSDLHYFYVYLIMCLTYNDQCKQRHESDPSEAILYTRRVRKYYNCNPVSSTACFALSAERETKACDLDMLYESGKFMLPVRRRDLCSSGTLGSVEWRRLNDISGKPITPIFNPDA